MQATIYLVGRVDAVEHNGGFRHGDAALLRPECGDAPPNLQVTRKDPLRGRHRLVVNDLLVLNHR